MWTVWQYNDDQLLDYRGHDDDEDENRAKMELLIRQAAKTDAGAIAGLLGELGYPTESDSVLKWLKTLEISTSDVVFVGEIRGSVVAFLSLHVIPYFTTGELVGRVLALAVKEEARNQGIGRAMMGAAEEQARKMGCKAVEVTSADYREGAHAFYARLGYPKTSAKFFKRIVE